MNAIIVTGLLALAGFGGYATADCTDLAGQGYLCAEVDESGADIDVYVEPNPPVAADATAECVAEEGVNICAGEDGVDFELDREDLGLYASGSIGIS